MSPRVPTVLHAASLTRQEQKRLSCVRKVTIDLSKAACWNDFHRIFARQFPFPDYYGRNMDAWIDCIRDNCSHADPLMLEIMGMTALKKYCPDVIAGINSCAEFINTCESDRGKEPVLWLIWRD